VQHSTCCAPPTTHDHHGRGYGDNDLVHEVTLEEQQLQVNVGGANWTLCVACSSGSSSSSGSRQQQQQ
jgi:hypothetical protein